MERQTFRKNPCFPELMTDQIEQIAGRVELGKCEFCWTKKAEVICQANHYRPTKPDFLQLKKVYLKCRKQHDGQRICRLLLGVIPAITG